MGRGGKSLWDSGSRYVKDLASEVVLNENVVEAANQAQIITAQLAEQVLR